MSTGDEEDELESYGTDMGREARASPVEWVLFRGNRLVLAAGILVGVYLLFVGLGWIGIIGFTNDDSITRVAGGMTAGTFSLVTLVVSINQLILSRELSAAGEARERLDGVMEFRRDIEDMANVPASPATPTRLLELIIEGINYQADTLTDAIEDELDEDGRGLIQSYVSGVKESTERADEAFEETEFGTFTALSAAINYNDAWQIYAGRHLRGRYRDDLSEGAHGAFEDLIDAIQLFNIARTHLKTTYVQRELTQFSRQTLYCGVPSILSAMVIGFLYGGVGGATINPALLPYVVSALIVVVVSPLALLASYILRTATVVRRTASIGPMIPQKAPKEDPFDVSYNED
jgi:hypothetical protein